MPLKKVIFIAGPTGIGKTALSVRLAKKINGEIICCDSMQVYKGMDILTAQPGVNDFSVVPHHLFKIISPKKNFSVAQYRKLAVKKIKEIHAKGKVPIFVGGTGLYVQALLDGLFSSPKEDKAYRRKLTLEAGKKGVDALYKKLKKIDSASAKVIHKNDLRRIMRALEIFHLTGKTMSELKKSSKGGIFGLYKICVICLFYKNRDLLYVRINNRVDKMLKNGLVEEINGLLRMKLGMTAGQALGIRHIRNFIDRKCSRQDAVELLKRDSRRYAKRQLSWFRREKRTCWIAADGEKSLDTIKNILYYYNK